MADPTKGTWMLSDERDGYRSISGTGWGSFARVWVTLEDEDGRTTPSPEGEANARLIALAPEMRDILKWIQWRGGDFVTDAMCPACGSTSLLGHTPDCRLGNLLQRLP